MARALCPWVFPRSFARTAASCSDLNLTTCDLAFICRHHENLVTDETQHQGPLAQTEYHSSTRAIHCYRRTHSIMEPMLPRYHDRQVTRVAECSPWRNGHAERSRTLKVTTCEKYAVASGERACQGCEANDQSACKRLRGCDVGQGVIVAPTTPFRWLSD